MQWWKMMLPGTMLAFAAIHSIAPLMGRRSGGRPRPVIVASGATVYVVVFSLCALGGVAAESSMFVGDGANKEPNMQNVGNGAPAAGGSKVGRGAADGGTSWPSSSSLSSSPTMRLQHQHPHQSPPSSSSLYDGFERRLNRLSEYARDRFDSSQEFRLNNDAAPAVPDGNDVNRELGIPGATAHVVKNSNRPKWNRRRKRQTTDQLQSLVINDKRLRQLRTNNGGREDDNDEADVDPFSNARLRMRKVLSVLIPNQQRRPTGDDADIWEHPNENEFAVNAHQKNNVATDGNWMRAKAKRIAAHRSHQQHQTKHLANEQEDNTNNNSEGYNLTILPLSNACELCPIYSSSAVSSSVRCCPQELDQAADEPQPFAPQHRGSNQKKAHLANKSKRQTERKAAQLKEDLHLHNNHQLMQHAAVYPEIVAKRPPSPRFVGGAAGNSYADFLNYYDQQQQVVGQPHNPSPQNLLSSSALLSSVRSAAAAVPDAGGVPSTGAANNLYPGVPNINFTAHVPPPASAASPLDYNNNHSAPHLSTPVTTNSSASSGVLPLNNATYGPDDGAPGNGGGGGNEAEEEASQSACAKYIDASNTSAVLQRVLDELERIRMFKEGQLAPEGSPCSILGSWNSEIIGLRFDINLTATAATTTSNNNNNEKQQEPDNQLLSTTTTQTTTAAAGAAEVPTTTTTEPTPPPTTPPPTPQPSLAALTIRLFDHNPPKRNTLMGTNWSTLGTALNHIGGPFSITATVPKEQVLATFTGICKTCGGQDTIFGTWSIAHPAKDCGDLQTAIETRRDIFRREMMFVKKQQRLEQLRLLQTNGAADNKEADIANESSTTTSREPSTTEQSVHKPVIHSADASLQDYDQGDADDADDADDEDY